MRLLLLFCIISISILMPWMLSLRFLLLSSFLVSSPLYFKALALFSGCCLSLFSLLPFALGGPVLYKEMKKIVHESVYLPVSVQKCGVRVYCPECRMMRREGEVAVVYGM